MRKLKWLRLFSAVSFYLLIYFFILFFWQTRVYRILSTGFSSRVSLPVRVDKRTRMSDFSCDSGKAAGKVYIVVGELADDQRLLPPPFSLHAGFSVTKALYEL